MRRIIFSIVFVPTLLLPMANSAQEAAPSIHLLARIGCLDCSGPRMLTTIRDIVIARDRVYVLDGSAPHVRAFDRSGRPVSSFGREGAGPGEFRLPIHLNVRADGQLEVFDYGQGRFTRFGSDGTQLATRTIGLGQFPVLSARSDNPDTYIITSEFRDTEQRVVRLGGDDAAPTRLAIGDGVRLAAGARVVRPILAARPVAGFAIGDGLEQYRIVILRPDGTREAAITRSVRRVKKTEPEVEADRRVRERLGQRVSQRMPGAQVPNSVADEYRRHFSAMAYDERGRLWVRTHRRNDATVFDVFSPRTQYLGEVIVPGNVGTFALGHGLIAASVTDELGTPYVVLYSIN